MGQKPSGNATAAFSRHLRIESRRRHIAVTSLRRSKGGFELGKIYAPMPGINVGYRLQYYQGTVESLVGKTIAKYGAGNSTLGESDSTMGEVRPDGAGTYRSADVVVHSASGSDLAVLWTQANRAAEQLCARANAGYSGGHFTGHVGSDVKGALHKLICVHDNAQRFDATNEEIAQTAWTFATNDMESVPWAQAARAATDLVSSGRTGATD